MLPLIHWVVPILKAHKQTPSHFLPPLPTPPHPPPFQSSPSPLYQLEKYPLPVYLSFSHHCNSKTQTFFSLSKIYQIATMIKTLNPYTTTATAKTAEIMSRYRPIAPKPVGSMDENSSMSQKIRESPYLRNLWPQMQARPTRTRKRGRTTISPPIIKRPRTSHVFGLSSTTHLTSPAKHLSLQRFSQLPVQNLIGDSSSLENSVTPSSNLVTLPLLSCAAAIPIIASRATVPEVSCMEPTREQAIDLNTTADCPEEQDLLQQLQEPQIPISNVISPQPVRPIGSSISVGCIREPRSLSQPVQLPKKPEEVEEEVELNSLPAVISDSNNKVRLANSAYKEMVGQPECSWLESMVSGDGRLGGNPCKRICGEVILHLPDTRMPVSSNAFSCWVRIEWGNQGNKNSISAFCEANRLVCDSKDYLFTWRFHIPNREGFPSRTNP